MSAPKTVLLFTREKHLNVRAPSKEIICDIVLKAWVAVSKKILSLWKKRNMCADIIRQFTVLKRYE